MMNATTAAPTTEVATGDLLGDARVMVADMIENITSIQERLEGQTGPEAERLRKETERLLSALHATKPGVVDLTCFLNRQPRDDREFGFPGRAAALCGTARPRLERSRFMFPEPSSVLAAVTVLGQDCMSSEDVAELQTRVAYYMAKMVVSNDGVAASAAMRRLIQTASIQQLSASKEITQEQRDLLASAKGSIAAFLFEARRRGRR